jgi:2-oxoisovalerate dehydrogenase E1 component alpha subunit
MTAPEGRNRVHELPCECTRNPAADENVVARFDVTYRRCLDASGVLAGEAPPLVDQRDDLVARYRAMTLARAFDVKAISLQRTGRIGTYPSCQGQEAVAVGVASAMADEDVLLPTYREQGAQLWRGVTLVELLLYWAGDERGSDYAGPRRDFPVCVPIASHTLHAAGVATAMKLRGEPRVAVCVLGDGATSEGDFYEAINLAGVWKLPVVFVVCNNQWAISVPRRAQTAADTLAQKAIAAGFHGEQVDGNDLLAVHHSAVEAIDRARRGDGPTLIEALTYRLGDHTTADDARRYRDNDEVSRGWAHDPIVRLRQYLAGRNWWSKDDEEALAADCRTQIEAAIATFEGLPPQPPTAMFDHLFETLPRPLEGQRARFEGQDDG